MVDRQRVEIPLLAERTKQSFEVAGGAGQIGLGNFNVMEADHRIHGKRSHPGTLPHHLAMDLAVGGNIDDDVVVYLSGAPQPLALAQGPLSPIVDLGSAGRGKPV
jgi:hypothetical protein